jgi:hypothetical protein
VLASVLHAVIRIPLIHELPLELPDLFIELRPPMNFGNVVRDRGEKMSLASVERKEIIQLKEEPYGE